MNCHVFWLTGLSGAGKSTVAESACKILNARGFAVRIIDGDEIRANDGIKLGYSREDVQVNNLRICTLIEEIGDEYDALLVPVIAPYQNVRELIAKRLANRIHFIYCNANIETVTRRDTKGLYRMAREGKINNLIGVGSGYPYDVPICPDLILPTNSSEQRGIEMCADILVNYILKTVVEPT